MYLKVLARDDNGVYVFDHIKRYSFHRYSFTAEEMEQQLALADVAIINAQPTDAPEGTFHVGWLTLKLTDGERVEILFDGLAFFCNETGKAVERFLAN